MAGRPMHGTQTGTLSGGEAGRLCRFGKFTLGNRLPISASASRRDVLQQAVGIPCFRSLSLAQHDAEQGSAEVTGEDDEGDGN
jgi:hypothetical protein